MEKYRLLYVHTNGDCDLVTYFESDSQPSVELILEQTEIDMDLFAEQKEWIDWDYNALEIAVVNKCYVVMTDKAMSGWGDASGKINKLIFHCDSWEQAEIVETNAKNRSDMKYVNVVRKKPSYNSNRYYVQEKTIEEYPMWYKRNSF